MMQMFLFYKIADLTTEENSGYGRYDFGFPNGNNKSGREYILIEIKSYNPNEKINKEENNIKNKKNKIKRNKNKNKKQII